MPPRYFQLTLLFLGTALPLSAADKVRGALLLHEISGKVVVSELGADAIVMRPGAVPISMPSLVNCRADYGSSAFFSASNGSFIFFKGSGSFGVERFEQTHPDAATWQSSGPELGQSRTIINFRSGYIAIDTRSMSPSSQYLVETPIGRITVHRALWQMGIEFDPRSRIFDFTITCSDGRVRFTDLQGDQFTLRAGQRLSGAGSRRTPSIEVGEVTDQTREQMQHFRQLVETYTAAAGELQVYEPHMRTIKFAPVASDAMPASSSRLDSDHRPIVIEHAKDPAPVTPFRGELRAPSAQQVDQF